MSSRQVAVKEKTAQAKASAHAPPQIFALPPVRWACRHRMGGSDIESYVQATDGLEVIAVAKQINGIDARANAELIVQAVNNYSKCTPIINELITVLEQCLEKGIDWSAEQEAETAIRRARQIIAQP